MYNGASLSSQEPDNDACSFSNIYQQAIDREKDRDRRAHPSKTVQTTADEDRVFDQTFHPIPEFSQIAVRGAAGSGTTIVHDRRNAQLEEPFRPRERLFLGTPT